MSVSPSPPEKRRFFRGGRFSFRSFSAGSFGHVLWIFLKYSVSVFCLAYAFWDVPLTDLAAARYSAAPMFGALAVSFAAYAMMGVRLSYMTTPPLSFRSTFCATLVGLAMNNVFPAKAGEITKAAWMGRDNGVPLQKTLGIVFMERFFDVNVLTLLNLWFLWDMGEHQTAALFAACLACGWSVLFFFRLCPRWAKRFTGLFGSGGLGRFVSLALLGVLENMSARRLAWLSASSLVVWCFYALEMLFCVNGVAGLSLPLTAALFVFAVSGLGTLLPSSPGAVGVYEAVTVAALERCGAAPDMALAAALFSHALQFLPVTLVGSVIFLKGR
jgi:uncharacterized membrane protein YbhN (UPF0104 family)